MVVWELARSDERVGLFSIWPENYVVVRQEVVKSLVGRCFAMIFE